MSIPETKFCAKCKINKNACEFTIVKTKRGKYNPHLTSRCKSCKAEDQNKHRKPYDSKYALGWKAKNPDKVKIYENRSYQKGKQRWEEFMKLQNCSRCGISDYRVLQWHHIDPSNKTMTIGAMGRKCKWSAIMEEVTKCICVCANCHFILHAENKNA